MIVLCLYEGNFFRFVFVGCSPVEFLHLFGGIFTV